jgi:lipopolysaccharide exporter
MPRDDEPPGGTEPRAFHEVAVDSTTVARSTRQTAVAQVLTQSLRLLSSIVLARLLTPVDFGVVAVALIITSLLDQLRDAGTGDAIIQRETVDQPLLNSVFLLNIVMGTFSCGLLVGFAGPLASALGNPSAAPVVQAFGLISLLASFGQIHQSLLRRSMRFGAVAVVNIASAVTSAIVSIAAALVGLTYWSLVLGALSAAIVTTAALWTLDPWRPSRGFSVDSLRSIWGFSWYLFLSNILYFVWSQVDKIIVSRSTGAHALGAYTMSQRFVSAPLTALGTVIGEVTFPAFSRRQNDNAALRSGFTRSSAVIALVTFPLMFGTAVIAQPLVAVLLGPKWLSAIPLVWILAPTGAIQSTTLNCQQLLLAKGRSDWSFRWGLVFLLVLGSLELYFSQWGVVGVAAGFAIGTILLTPFTLIIVFRPVQARLRDYTLALFPYVWMSVLMALVVHGSILLMRRAGAPNIVLLVVGMLVGVVVYAGLLRVIRPPALADAISAMRGGLR